MSDVEEYYEVEVLRWNDYIKRKDYGQKKWWAFDCDTLLHPDFFEIDGDHFKVYCWIISVANKFGSAQIKLHKKHAEKMLHISSEKLHDAIMYLNDKRIKTRIRSNSNGSVRKRTIPSPRIDKNRVEEIREEYIAHPAAVRPSDFENVYEKYPRKQGKSRGLAKMKAQVKTLEDLHHFGIALENYNKHLKKNRIDQQFIKHFDTWVGEWRDWIDPQTGTAAKPSASASAVVTKSFGEIQAANELKRQEEVSSHVSENGLNDALKKFGLKSLA